MRTVPLQLLTPVLARAKDVFFSDGSPPEEEPPPPPQKNKKRAPPQKAAAQEPDSNITPFWRRISSFVKDGRDGKDS
jgi:hypothetical protein